MRGHIYELHLFDMSKGNQVHNPLKKIIHITTAVFNEDKSKIIAGYYSDDQGEDSCIKVIDANTGNEENSFILNFPNPEVEL